MRRAPVAALAALVCSAALAGCTEDSSAGPTTVPSPSTSSGSSSTAEPTTSTSPTPSTPPTDPPPPVLPALAKEQSTAGAKAFVRYTIDALNYGYLAGRSDAFKTVSDSVCAVCSALQSNIDRIERSGGHQVGGDWSPISIDKVPSGVPTEPILIAEVTVAAGWTTPSANAPREKIRPANVFYEFHLHWVADEWQLTDLRQG